MDPQEDVEVGIGSPTDGTEQPDDSPSDSAAQPEDSAASASAGAVDGEGGEGSPEERGDAEATSSISPVPSDIVELGRDTQVRILQDQMGGLHFESDIKAQQEEALRSRMEEQELAERPEPYEFRPPKVRGQDEASNADTESTIYESENLPTFLMPDGPDGKMFLLGKRGQPQSEDSMEGTLEEGSEEEGEEGGPPPPGFNNGSPRSPRGASGEESAQEVIEMLKAQVIAEQQNTLLQTQQLNAHLHSQQQQLIQAGLHSRAQEEELAKLRQQLQDQGQGDQGESGDTEGEVARLKARVVELENGPKGDPGLEAAFAELQSEQQKSSQRLVDVSSRLAEVEREKEALKEREGQLGGMVQEKDIALADLRKTIQQQHEQISQVKAESVPKAEAEAAVGKLKAENEELTRRIQELERAGAGGSALQPPPSPPTTKIHLPPPASSATGSGSATPRQPGLQSDERRAAEGEASPARNKLQRSSSLSVTAEDVEDEIPRRTTVIFPARPPGGRAREPGVTDRMPSHPLPLRPFPSPHFHSTISPPPPGSPLRAVGSDIVPQLPLGSLVPVSGPALDEPGGDLGSRRPLGEPFLEPHLEALPGMYHPGPPSTGPWNSPPTRMRSVSPGPPMAPPAFPPASSHRDHSAPLMHNTYHPGQQPEPQLPRTFGLQPPGRAPSPALESGGFSCFPANQSLHSSGIGHQASLGIGKPPSTQTILRQVYERRTLSPHNRTASPMEAPHAQSRAGAQDVPNGAPPPPGFPNPAPGTSADTGPARWGSQGTMPQSAASPFRAPSPGRAGYHGYQTHRNVGGSVAPSGGQRWDSPSTQSRLWH